MKMGGCHLSLCLIVVASLDFADVLDPEVYENCTDYRNQVVPHGERYRPMNADACHSCSCEFGRPEMCQSRLCSAPKTCANPVQVDDTCCEFECPEDGGSAKSPPSNGTALEPTGRPKDDLLSTTNLGLRLVASTVTSFLILALLLFMIHRLRQRRLLLMLRRLDMNGSHLSSAPFGVRRYSFDDDGSVGYLTGQDQVDFAPYDEPPPPYTFWKPPESYFPQEEAPPPYEVSNNNNSINNAVNSTIHQNGGAAVPIAQVAPLIPNPYPMQCITPNAYVPPACVYANGALPNGNLPSLTQVPLRTNNFHMNNLDEVREPGVQRHSVPIQDLNVVGSLSSLNSSQSELNDSQAAPAPASGSTLVIRSDAVYEEYSAGMLPPLSPGTSALDAISNDETQATVAVPVCAISTGTYSVKRSKYGRCPDVKKPSVAAAAHAATASPLKCRSCSDVTGCCHRKKPSHDVGKRRSLQPGVDFCPDPTTWSETSSSSSPTYERTTGTLSPTSSDSSSVDYNFGRGCADTAHNLPRRTHSDTQFGGGRKAAAQSTAATSSSLDRTLFNLRSKISLKKKMKKQQQQAPKGQPSKLRKLLGGLHAAPTTAANEERERQDLVAAAVTAATPQNGNPASEVNLRHCAVGQRPGWRTPRILYVSDGDISLRSLLNPQEGGEDKEKAASKMASQARPRNLDLETRCRPHSYDFGDLRSVDAECGGEADTAAAATATTYPIKEEGTPASGEDATRSDNPSSLPTNTVDCCCSLSSDRLGSSWDSFTCTCSSRASFGSGSSSSSGGAVGRSRDTVGSPDSPAWSAAMAAVSAAEMPRTRADTTLLNRSGSVCSETGEKKHRMFRQCEETASEARTSTESQVLSPVSELSGGTTTREESAAASPDSALAAGPPPPTLAVANRIRVTIGTWKGSHESYI